MYDLSRAGDVERLPAMRERAGADGVTVPANVDFAYAAGDAVGVERVRAELTSIDLVPQPGAEVTLT